MNTKKLWLLVAVVLLIATLPMATFAQSDEVLVKPYQWDDRIVYSDQNVVLDARWSACRFGAVQSFLTATNIWWELTKDGTILTGTDTNQFWGPIEMVPATMPDTCMGKPPEEAPVTIWRYPIGNLEAGDYQLHFVWSLDHPVTDVADYDGDGTPDLITGTIVDISIAIRVMDR